jgi:hypothetical protein
MWQGTQLPYTEIEEPGVPAEMRRIGSRSLCESASDVDNIDCERCG